MCPLPYCAGRRQWCCSSCCIPSFGRQAQDARHFGRYVPEGQLFMACARIKLLVMMLSRCVPLYCRHARVAGHHALLGPFLVQTVQMVVQFLAKVMVTATGAVIQTV